MGRDIYIIGAAGGEGDQEAEHGVPGDGLKRGTGRGHRLKEAAAGVI